MQQWIKSLQEKDPRRLYAISTARKIMVMIPLESQNESNQPTKASPCPE